jgi:hypothetical protein
VVAENTLGVGHGDAPRTLTLAAEALGVRAAATNLKYHGPSSRPRAVYANGAVAAPEPRWCCPGRPCDPSTCPASFYAALALDPAWAPPGDRRTRLRCVGTNDGAFLRGENALHRGCQTADAAARAVNAILRKKNGSFVRVCVPDRRTVETA